MKFLKIYDLVSLQDEHGCDSWATAWTRAAPRGTLSGIGVRSAEAEKEKEQELELE